MLGYDTYEDNRTFETEDKVKRYTTSKMEFPCLILSGQIEMFKFNVLKNMFNSSTQLIEGLQTIDIYYEQGDKVVKLGKITSQQVKSFLSLFSNANIVGYLDKDTKLEGDYLYVLTA